MKSLFATLAFHIAFTAMGYSQDGFDKWNRNYKDVDIVEILEYEKKYADSIETEFGASARYARVDKFRFTAAYLGKKRKINSQVLQSMKTVFKLFLGGSTQLDGAVKNEYLFQIGEVQFWVPIQKQLEKPFKKEIKKSEKAHLYCLFLNEHSGNGLFNTIFICEFKKE